MLVRVLALLISLEEDTHRKRKGRVPVYWEILGVRMGAASQITLGVPCMDLLAGREGLVLYQCPERAGGAGGSVLLLLRQTTTDLVALNRTHLLPFSSGVQFQSHLHRAQVNVPWNWFLLDL